MNLKPLALNIDGSIPLQPQLSAQLAEMSELRSEEGHLRLWADQQGLRNLRHAVSDLRSRIQEPWLTFIGSGDFHHVTLALLETLPEKFQPTTVVLIDNHPDWFIDGPQFHCGNWLSGVAKLPWVEQIIMVGQNSSDIRGSQFWMIPFQKLCSAQIRLIPFAKQKVRVPFRWPKEVRGVARSERQFYGVDLYFETLKSRGLQNVFDQLANELKGRNVYVTIDKDCLDLESAKTDWDQGGLTTEDLVLGISKLVQSVNVIGADVCGEKAPLPLKGILKRIDAGRLREEQSEKFGLNRLNEQTNLKILKAFLPQFSFSRNNSQIS